MVGEYAHPEGLLRIRLRAFAVNPPSPRPRKNHRDCLRIVMSKFFTIDWYIDQTIAA